MIASTTEYEKAQVELKQLEARLERLHESHPGAKGYTKAGIHKMISRIHEELAIYEGTRASKESDPQA